MGYSQFRTITRRFTANVLRDTPSRYRKWSGFWWYQTQWCGMIKRFTGKPVIIEGRLALKEINPLGENECLKCEDAPCVAECMMFEAQWYQNESALRTLFVNNSESRHLSITRSFNGLIVRFKDKVVHADLNFTADIDENNELFNLKICTQTK